MFGADGLYIMPDEEYFLFDEPYGTDNNFEQEHRLRDKVQICAQKVFGIKSPYPWQRLAIANVLEAVEAAEKAASQGMSTTGIAANFNEEKITELYDEDGIFRGRQIILLPTGAGKSLCFQIPALLMSRPTLVVYPLLALMNEQFKQMKKTPLSPAFFCGGQTEEERFAQFARLEGKDGLPPAKMIIVNPEILAQKSIFERIKKMNIANFVIDEAHCVTEWGDSFRPAYLELSRFIKELSPAAVTAFTATASESVLKRISEILFDGKAHLVRGESDRPNIIYSVKQCLVKEPVLLELIQNQKKPAVIFCSSRSKTEKTAHFLRYALNTQNVRFYHAGLEREEKKAVENWFGKSRDGVLVSTCAWGMGVSKKDVKTVIHLEPPCTAEAYIQEAGRAGRDGSEVNAILLWSPQDTKKIENFTAEKRTRAAVLQTFAESGRCRREVLLEALGENLSSGEEKNACSGCDICSGTAKLFPNDEAVLLDFLKTHEKQFTKSELIVKLKKDNPNWRAADLNSLIMQLKSAGKIKENFFLYRGKLSAVIPVNH